MNRTGANIASLTRWLEPPMKKWKLFRSPSETKNEITSWHTDTRKAEKSIDTRTHTMAYLATVWISSIAQHGFTFSLEISTWHNTSTRCLVSTFKSCTWLDSLPQVAASLATAHKQIQPWLSLVVIHVIAVMIQNNLVLHCTYNFTMLTMDTPSTLLLLWWGMPVKRKLIIMTSVPHVH